MWKQQRIEGLMAASLYEPLSAEEQAEMEAYLAKHPDAAGELAALRSFTESIPTSNPVFEGDLWPALQAQLDSPPRRSLWWRPLMPVALCAAVLTLIVSPWVFSKPPVTSTPPSHTPSPMEVALAQAQTQAPQDFAGAVAALGKALQTYPNDPLAGEAQLSLAALEFGHGQRYAQAYEAYERARQRYPEAWGRHPEQVAQFNLLDETRDMNFEPLRQLDAAANGGDRAFEHLEQVIARYPGSLVAMHAVDTLCRDAARNTPGLSAIAAIEQVRECCSDPVAVAQVTMALGDVSWNDLHDAARARAAYGVVKEKGPMALAQLAEEGLVAIDASQSAIR